MAAGPLIRLLAVGALDGAEPAWRTLVNAIALDVYTVDAVVQIGGLGVTGETERAWRALAQERLADVATPLTTLAADAPCGPLALPGGRGPSVYAGGGDVREVVQRDRPALAICGGAPATENRRMWLGDTLCLDPGSLGSAEGERGHVCGWVADLVATGVMVARPFRT